MRQLSFFGLSFCLLAPFAAACGNDTFTAGDGAGGGNTEGDSGNGGSTASGGGTATGGQSSGGSGSGGEPSGSGGADDPGACPATDLVCNVEPGGGILDCGELEEKFVATLDEARRCSDNPECSAETLIVSNCGCPVIVNDDNCEAVDAARQARYDWLGGPGCETGCIRTCQDLHCEAVVFGLCDGERCVGTGPK